MYLFKTTHIKDQSPCNYLTVHVMEHSSLRGKTNSNIKCTINNWEWESLKLFIAWSLQLLHDNEPWINFTSYAKVLEISSSYIRSPPHDRLTGAKKLGQHWWCINQTLFLNTSKVCFKLKHYTTSPSFQPFVHLKQPFKFLPMPHCTLHLSLAQESHKTPKKCIVFIHSSSSLIDVDSCQ